MSRVELSALTEAGAHTFDPVAMHFIEVLARRAAGQPDSVRHHLDRKVKQAAATLQARLSRSLQKAEQTIDNPRGQEGTLGSLLTDMQVQARGDAAAQSTLGYFRDNWSRIQTTKQVTQALDQAPKNAGPINSHGLVLRSLALMRDASPVYLSQFVSYVDTLIALENRQSSQLTAAKQATKPVKSNASAVRTKAIPMGKDLPGKQAQTGKP